MVNERIILFIGILIFIILCGIVIYKCFSNKSDSFVVEDVDMMNDEVFLFTKAYKGYLQSGISVYEGLHDEYNHINSIISKESLFDDTADLEIKLYNDLAKYIKYSVYQKKKTSSETEKIVNNLKKIDSSFRACNHGIGTGGINNGKYVCVGKLKDTIHTIQQEMKTYYIYNIDTTMNDEPTSIGDMGTQNPFDYIRGLASNIIDTYNAINIPYDQYIGQPVDEHGTEENIVVDGKPITKKGVKSALSDPIAREDTIDVIEPTIIGGPESLPPPPPVPVRDEIVIDKNNPYIQKDGPGGIDPALLSDPIATTQEMTLINVTTPPGTNIDDLFLKLNDSEDVYKICTTPS